MQMQFSLDLKSCLKIRILITSRCTKKVSIWIVLKLCWRWARFMRKVSLMIINADSSPLVRFKRNKFKIIQPKRFIIMIKLQNTNRMPCSNLVTSWRLVNTKKDIKEERIINMHSAFILVPLSFKGVAEKLSTNLVNSKHTGKQMIKTMDRQLGSIKKQQLKVTQKQ